MTVRQGIAALLSGGAVAVAVAACGVDTGSEGRAGTGTQPGQTVTDGGRTTATTGTTTTRTTRTATLPAPPPNTVRINGLERSSPAREISTRFASTNGARVAFVRSPGDDRSFADLCAGRVDVVEVSREPTAREIAACRARGIELVDDPLQIGSDAIVLATRNESDVGGDCVSVTQARDIFRSGSPYSNWSQLGFDDIPLRTTGREDGADNFEFFGQTVLGLENASLGDVRTDYRVRRSDRAERLEVTNEARIERAIRRARARLARDRRLSRPERRRQVDQARRAAERQALREIEAENRRIARRNVTLTETQKRRLERRNRLLVERRKRAAVNRENRLFDRDQLRRARAAYRRDLRRAIRRGTVGPFRFSYYELFEDELRPLEIDFGVAVTEDGRPVTLDDFPPEQRPGAVVRRPVRTPAGTTTIQTTTVPPVETTQTATTETVPGQTPTTPTADAASGDVQTIPSQPVPDQRLPDRTRDGKRVFQGPMCVFPSQITITTGAYPLTRRIFLYTSKQALRRELVRDFLRFQLDRAREVAVENRLVPITEAQYTLAREVVDNGGEPLTPAERRRRAGGTSTTPQPGTFDPATGTVATTPATTTSTTATTATTPTDTTGAAPAGGGGIPGVSARGG